MFKKKWVLWREQAALKDGWFLKHIRRVYISFFFFSPSHSPSVLCAERNLIPRSLFTFDTSGKRMPVGIAKRRRARRKMQAPNEREMLFWWIKGCGQMEAKRFLTFAASTRRDKPTSVENKNCSLSSFVREVWGHLESSFKCLRFLTHPSEFLNSAVLFLTVPSGWIAISDTHTHTQYTWHTLLHYPHLWWNKIFKTFQIQKGCIT